MRLFKMTALFALTICLCPSIASAQGRGRGGGWGGNNMNRRGGGDTGAMVEHGGKIYAVTGATLARISFKTFEVEQRADLTSAGRTEEEEQKARRASIDRLDRNKDGHVDEAGDGDRWRWARWLDRNQDGKVTTDEAMIRPAPGASGQAVLQIMAGKLVMLRGGYIFKFDIKTLELESSARVLPPEPEPEPEEEKEAC